MGNTVYISVDVVQNTVKIQRDGGGGGKEEEIEKRKCMRLKKSEKLECEDLVW